MFNEQEQNIMIMALMYLKNDYTQEDLADLRIGINGYEDDWDLLEITIQKLMEDLVGPTWDEEATTANLKMAEERMQRRKQRWNTKTAVVGMTITKLAHDAKAGHKLNSTGCQAVGKPTRRWTCTNVLNSTVTVQKTFDTNDLGRAGGGRARRKPFDTNDLRRLKKTSE